jgi:hypothetical protein
MVQAPKVGLQSAVAAAAQPKASYSFRPPCLLRITTFMRLQVPLHSLQGKFSSSLTGAHVIGPGNCSIQLCVECSTAIAGISAVDK